MAKITIPRLDLRQSGNRTYYYWVPSASLKKQGGKRQALGQDIREAQKKAESLNDQVEQWRAGGAKPRQVKKFIKGGTMDQLIARYEEEAMPNLAPNTQKDYRSKFRLIARWAGPEQVAHLNRASVKKFRDALLRPGPDGEVKTARAQGTMSRLKTLLDFAIDIGLLPEDAKNPASEQNMPAADPRDQAWSPEAMELMTAQALEIGQPGLALAMHLGREVGQREEDILLLSLTKWVEIPRHKLNPEDFDRLAEPGPDGHPKVMGIRLRQGKTRVWVEIPIVGETRRLMEQAADQARRIGTTVLLQEWAIPRQYRERRQLERQIAKELEEQGIIRPKADQIEPLIADRLEPRPWTLTRFQRAVADIRAGAAEKARARGDAELAAEIEDLQYRDLRRTAVVWLGELGIEDHLIAAITGHKLDRTRKILETYMPRTTKMAGKAIALRQERGQVTPIGATREKKA